MAMADTLSLSEAARRVGVNRHTLSRAIDRGDIPVPKLRIGRSVRLPRGLFDQWISGGSSHRPLPGTEGGVPKAPPSTVSKGIA